MDEFDKAEFWKALGRLYDSSLKTQENIELLSGSMTDLRETIAGLRDTVDGVAGALGNLRSATEHLHSVAEIHERRLDRYEVTVEAILEELRRRREERQ